MPEECNVMKNIKNCFCKTELFDDVDCPVHGFTLVPPSRLDKVTFRVEARFWIKYTGPTGVIIRDGFYFVSHAVKHFDTLLSLGYSPVIDRESERESLIKIAKEYIENNFVFNAFVAGQIRGGWFSVQARTIWNEAEKGA